MGVTVIIIDDDQDDIDVMTEVINEIDHSILTISYINPNEAIQAILNDLILYPDYIFIDINMAPITGDRCLKELRRSPTLLNTKIVMFSTFIPRPVAKSLMDAGANFTFQKPDTFNDYRIILGKLFTQVE